MDTLSLQNRNTLGRNNAKVNLIIELFGLEGALKFS